MATAEKLLGFADIKKFVKTHLDAKDAIERAAEDLKDSPDALVALRKLLPALSEKSISVFFSYKKKDEPTAKKVVQTLRDYSADKLKISYQAEFTEEIAGKQWRDKIREAIRPANWFILLLPDPSDDWDWCLFETGLFVAHRTSADRLICLHHPDTELPPQIEDYQAVKATPSEVEAFLKMVYVNENAIPGMPPLSPSLEKKIPTIALEIVDAVHPPRKILEREIFEPWVRVRVEGAKSLATVEDLDTARVLEANQKALDLFGFLKTPETWHDLRSEVHEPDGDARWRSELFHVIRRIASNRKFYPVQAVFRTEDGRMYRPVAHAIDRCGGDGPIDSFHITFGEEIGAPDRSAMPQDLSILADLLRFTFRFRWEVLKKFSQPPLTDADLQRLDNAMRRIKKDWESRHTGGEEELFAVFKEEHQRRFIAMSLAWKEISNEDGTGKLDRALESGDKEAIPPLLAEFLPMNKEFLEIATERFSELISSEKPAAVGPPPTVPDPDP